jgi:hypothetical protein
VALDNVLGVVTAGDMASRSVLSGRRFVESDKPTKHRKFFIDCPSKLGNWREVTLCGNRRSTLTIKSWPPCYVSPQMQQLTTDIGSRHYSNVAQDDNDLEALQHLVTVHERPFVCKLIRNYLVPSYLQCRQHVCCV